MSQGPPYRPSSWSLGGTPEVRVDIPITAVFLALFIGGAVTHMSIFQMNKRRGHKFLFNALLFGFCMARITTTILRIASVSKSQNIRLAIAAQIFVAAGVLLIFIINLLWSQRIVRSLHPRFGWHPAFSTAFKVVYVLIGLTLAIIITATVQSFYTLRPSTRTTDRDLQLYGTTFLTIISFLPIPMTLLAFAVPRGSDPDNFGQGQLRTKVAILMTGATLLCLGAAFRCGTAWLKPVHMSQPLPAYYSKACFYVFNFLVEILVVYFYAIMRVDLRFHIPNGAKGPGSYKARSTPNISKDDVEMPVETKGTQEEDDGVRPSKDGSDATGGATLIAGPEEKAT
ncbi:hypothetical protein BDV95DRAFT_343859 [Massariosphaeria phaeospora]|uniref:Family c-likeg-protein-coupled receptor protein n=1 Tax=Massariosphaeria phaeospora TaxID=100035 RepID=A0A7C8IC70_9PLEO|nr:hypothetical protein BDV95DRAFT_343859 [Massariosphaeria phaeospora]